jgi:hypothetical protein
MKFRFTIVIAVAVASIVVAGCGKKNQVGTGLKQSNGGGSGAIGLTTTTAAPPTTAAPTATTAKSTATTAKPTPTTPAPEQPFFTFIIQKDAPQINPTRGSCAVGKICRWENHDSVPRSIVADDNTFASPMIAPGGHWDYRPAAKGSHNITDGTRPYATGVVNFF